MYLRLYLSVYSIYNNIYSNSNSWDIILYSDISVMLFTMEYDGNSKKEKRKTLDKKIDFFHFFGFIMHTHHFI